MSERILRVFPAYMSGDAGYIYKIDKRFIKVWAALKVSRTKAINKIFLSGLETMEDKLELEGMLDERSFAIHRQRQEIEATLAEQNDLEFIYEHSSLEDFQLFCKEKGIDVDSFLASYEYKVPRPQSRSRMMESWLDDLLVDGETQSVENIKTAAQEARIVIDDNDWNLMSNIASRKKYSANAPHGAWRKLKIK